MKVVVKISDEPTKPMKRIFDEIQKFFRDLFELSNKDFPTTVVEPPIDIQETPNEIIVIFDVPGVEKEEIAINAVEDKMEILIETRIPFGEKEAKIIRQERPIAYTRSLSLPAKVIPEEGKASLNHGVLEVRFLKSKPAEGVKIDIE